MSSAKEVINIDEELQKASKQMDDAESALMKLGYPEEQWLLIRNYILSATLHSQLITAKGFETLPTTV
jgi:hypothetical protein